MKKMRKCKTKSNWKIGFSSCLPIAISISILGCELDEEQLLELDEENVEVHHNALRGGEIVTGFTGVVDFFTEAGQDTIEPTATCTGSMIAPNVVLTAAHCIDSLGSGNSGSHDFTIRYYDPDRGIRIVFDGNADWAYLPSWTGYSKQSDANSDLGVIKIPGRFKDTGYHDYLRIYSDYGNALETTLTAYGAGRYTYSHKTDNKLRTSWFHIENAEYNHIVADTRKKVSICKGDSGGPWIYTTSGVPTIAAVTSNTDVDPDSEGTFCTNNDAPFDDVWACRTNWKHMQWVENKTGLSCDLHRGASKDYRRCFDLPFIEDVDLEGEYDPNLAAAIAMVMI